MSTGIAGLDSLIEGGIPRGFTVLVAGNPGTGKTILASHFLFEGLGKDESGLYVSFSESKEQFYVNMEKLGINFRSFEQKGKFVFLDFASVTQQGMRDALEEVLATVVENKTKRLVVDSISAISHSYQNEVINARIILHTVLGKILRLEGVTSLLVAEIPTGRDSTGLGIEESITDGNIWLKHGPSDAAPILLNIFKMRGTRIIKEPHVCVINSGKGMTLYQKQHLDMTYHVTNERMSSGIAGIDRRADGGFLKGTVTGIVGAIGTGKTTFAFQFIAEGVKRGEAGLFYSLEESADEIRQMAKNFGYDVKDLERKGLKILARNAEYQSPDAFIAEIAREIERSPVKRMAIDGISSFGHATIQEEDGVYVVVKRLVSLSRENEITTIFSILSVQQVDLVLKDLGSLSALFQNIVLLRYAELEGKMLRSMITLKMRSTPHDDSILQFDISSIETTDGGSSWTEGPIKITGSLEGYAGVMTGTAQRLPQGIKEKEQEILHREIRDRSLRKEEFLRAEENIASRLEDERERRISEYKDRRTKGKGAQDGGKKKHGKKVRSRR